MHQRQKLCTVHLFTGYGCSTHLQWKVATLSFRFDTVSPCCVRDLVHTLLRKQQIGKCLQNFESCLSKTEMEANPFLHMWSVKKQTRATHRNLSSWTKVYVPFHMHLCTSDSMSITFILPVFFMLFFYFYVALACCLFLSLIPQPT